ncbi:2534_t:CDS:2, partial [Dentiscutata heterogama]
IFIETHSELTTLYNEFNELYKHYNTNNDSDEIVDDEEFFIESQTDDSIIEQTDDRKVDIKLAINNDNTTVNLLCVNTKPPSKDEFSDEITPPGLSLEWQ